jgi:hypothetical protein
LVCIMSSCAACVLRGALVVCGLINNRLLMNISCNIQSVKRIIIMKIMKNIHALVSDGVGRVPRACG